MFSAVGFTHLSTRGPCGPLLFNTCSESCHLRTILLSLCGEQLLFARPLVAPVGLSRTERCTGHVLPPAGVSHLLFYDCIQNKVTENRLFQFIHTEIGWICISSQNNPEIWLHSIPQPLEWTIFLLAPRQELCFESEKNVLHVGWCAFVARMLLSTFLSVYVLVYISLFVYFRRRSCKPAWSNWGKYSAFIRTIQLKLLTVLRFTTEWPI